MSITSILICLSGILGLALGKSKPPSLCFEPFTGLDCGGSPLNVLYYYKSGSRCEVAIWRGCPTRNKFQDEYECINTCIFTERERSEERHNFGNEDNYQMEYEKEIIPIDEPAATAIAAESGYAADDEEGANGVGEKDRKEADAEEKANDENAATENADGENDNNDKNAAEAGNENVAHEANNEAGEANQEEGAANNEGAEANKEVGEANEEAGEGDEETKIETTSEGTMEIGSEDIGAN